MKFGGILVFACPFVRLTVFLFVCLSVRLSVRLSPSVDMILNTHVLRNGCMDFSSYSYTDHSLGDEGGGSRQIINIKVKNISVPDIGSLVNV